jgi:hypothetical protein
MIQQVQRGGEEAISISHWGQFVFAFPPLMIVENDYSLNADLETHWRSPGHIVWLRRPERATFS